MPCTIRFAAGVVLQVNSYDIYDSQKQPAAPVEAPTLLIGPVAPQETVEVLSTDIVPVAAEPSLGKDTKAKTGNRRATKVDRRVSSFARPSECVHPAYAESCRT